MKLGILGCFHLLQGLFTAHSGSPAVKAERHLASLVFTIIPCRSRHHTKQATSQTPLPRSQPLPCPVTWRSLRKLVNSETGCVTPQPEETCRKTYLRENKMAPSREEHPRLRKPTFSLFCFSHPGSLLPLLLASQEGKHRGWRELRRLPRRHMNSALKQGGN